MIIMGESAYLCLNALREAMTSGMATADYGCVVVEKLQIWTMASRMNKSFMFAT